MIKISIIIPVYNVEKYINKCLDSILNQTLTDIEIIIINDGSNDKSLEICKQYSEKDSRIILIDKKNEGVSVARNKGIEVSKGEYILFVDSDDWIDENSCEIMYKEIQKNKADLFFCNHVREYGTTRDYIDYGLDEKIIEKDEIKEKIIFPLIEEEDKNKVHLKASFRGPLGKLYKREIIQKSNIYFNHDLIIGEDFIFNLQYLRKTNKIVMSKEYFYHYFKNDESTTNRYKEDSWSIYRKLLIAIEQQLKIDYKKEEFVDRLNKLKIKYVFWCIENELNPQNQKTNAQKIEYIKKIRNDDLVKPLLKDYAKNLNGTIYKMFIFSLRYKIYYMFILYEYYNNYKQNKG